MNNFLNLNSDEISSQLGRAEIQKNKLIKNILFEYEIYLQLVRKILPDAVEKGLDSIYSYSSMNNNLLNSSELFVSFEEKIKDHILSKLPLITIEQLKLGRITEKVEEEINLDNLDNLISFSKLKGNLEKKSESISVELPQFHIEDENNSSSNYYQDEDVEKLLSVDLDKNDRVIYYSNNLDTDKSLFVSMLELLEEEYVYNFKSSKNINNNQTNIFQKTKNLEIFNCLENSLENLLMDVSYEINLELYNSNFIESIISAETFKYLLRKNSIIKNPSPFVINFDLNNLGSFKNLSNSKNIFLLNISITELEFKNFNISIQKNKINQLKNKFNLLVKKECYWRQKEKSFNKIRRKL